MKVNTLRDDVTFANLFGSRDNDRDKIELYPKGTERYLNSVISKNYRELIPQPKNKKLPWVYYFDNHQLQFSSIKNMRDELGVSLKDIAFNIEELIPVFRYFLRDGEQMRRSFNGELFPQNLVFLLMFVGQLIKVEVEYYSPSGYWNVWETILDENSTEYIDGEERAGVHKTGFILKSPTGGIFK